jgi:hypothetical protein
LDSVSIYYYANYASFGRSHTSTQGDCADERKVPIENEEDLACPPRARPDMVYLYHVDFVIAMQGRNNPYFAIQCA